MQLTFRQELVVMVQLNTDYAIKKIIDNAKKKPWFANVL
jgi:hypothetical protein